MRTIVKAFVVGTLGLAVLFASPGVSLAQRQPKVQRYSECQCKCFYSTHAEGAAAGVLTFIPQPNNTSCSFTAVDIYVPCKDKAGVVHPSTWFSDCKFIPGIVAPPGPLKPPATTK